MEEQIPGMGVHTVVLRRRGRCARCAAELAAGELARFDDITHEISCLQCRDRSHATRVAAARKAVSPPPAPHPSEAERRRIRALIADARAALEEAQRAS